MTKIFSLGKTIDNLIDNVNYLPEVNQKVILVATIVICIVSVIIVPRMERFINSVLG